MLQTFSENACSLSAMTSIKPLAASGNSTRESPSAADTDIPAPRRVDPPHRDALPSQADVARLAGVSTATVSRAVNHPELVRPEAAARIAAIAQALGYVPDSAGRALSSRRTRLAGVIVPTIVEPGLARGVEAVQQCLETAGLALLFACSGDEPERELAQARMLIGRGVEALVLAGTAHLPALRQLLAAQGIPCVCLDSVDPAWPGVGLDRRAAGAIAAGHLLDLGHGRLALLTSVARDDRAGAEWAAGIGQALAPRGLTLADRMRALPRDLDMARAAARDLLALPQPPTAIVCDHDLLAFGVLRECAALGVAVPDRLSVVGCGDFDLARQAQPPLTTLRVPAADLGRLAAETLLRRLAGDAPPEHNQVAPKLVLRGSTGRPPSG